MSSGNFKPCLQITLKHEGGYTADRRDRGNWTTGVIGKGALKGTKYGISAMAYPHLDIKNLTIDQAGVYYRKDYWNPPGCDALPAGVDLTIFDYAVNSGVSRAKKALASAKGGTAKALVASINDSRLSFLRSLKTWGTYGKGWARRVGDVRARALVMAGAVAADLKADAKASDARAKAKVDQAATTGAAGGGTGGAAVAAVETGVNWPAVAALCATVVVLGAVAWVLWRRSKDHREVASAALAVAAELESGHA